MAPDWDNETLTTALGGVTNNGDNATASGSKWFQVEPRCIILYTSAYTDREEPELLTMKKERQKFGKPPVLIGNPVAIQKMPYPNHRRNSARA